MKKGGVNGFMQRGLHALSRPQRVGRITLCGAPVYWRWSLIVMFLAHGFMSRRHPEMWPIISVSWLIIVGVHEYGHAFVARRFGYRVSAITFGAFHGSCVYQAPEYEAHEVAVAWGGVAAQAVLFVVPFVLHTALGRMPPPPVRLLLVELSYVNLFVLVLNLLPIRGFDGHTAWRAIPLG